MAAMALAAAVPVIVNFVNVIGARRNVGTVSILSRPATRCQIAHVRLPVRDQVIAADAAAAGSRAAAKIVVLRILTPVPDDLRRPRGAVAAHLQGRSAHLRNVRIARGCVGIGGVIDAIYRSSTRGIGTDVARRVEETLADRIHAQKDCVRGVAGTVPSPRTFPPENDK